MDFERNHIDKSSRFFTELPVSVRRLCNAIIHFLSAWFFCSSIRILYTDFGQFNQPNSEQFAARFQVRGIPKKKWKPCVTYSQCLRNNYIVNGWTNSAMLLQPQKKWSISPGLVVEYCSTFFRQRSDHRLDEDVHCASSLKAVHAWPTSGEAGNNGLFWMNGTGNDVSIQLALALLNTLVSTMFCLLCSSSTLV